nr:hypothetical protein [Sinorhizobium meliloti]
MQRHPVSEDRSLELGIGQGSRFRIPFDADTVGTAQIASRQIVSGKVRIGEIDVAQIRMPEMNSRIEVASFNRLPKDASFATRT